MQTRKTKFFTSFAEGVVVSISAHVAAWFTMLTVAGAFKFFGHVAGVTAANILVNGF
jgi:hypothetical protein